jgi:hypothetical protein
VNDIIIDCSDFGSWKATLLEITNWRQPPLGTRTPSGAEFIGNGYTADVWSLPSGNKVIKLCRHRAGRNIPRDYMDREIETYQLLEKHGAGSLPKLYGYGRLECGTEEGAACGWAVFEKVSGRSLEPDEIERLDDKTRKHWVSALVRQVAKLEICLAGIRRTGTIPDSWREHYVEERVALVKRWAQKFPERVTARETALADWLKELIINEEKGEERILISGDLNFKNILYVEPGEGDDQASMRFIDPMFRLGTPHEQWRQMAPIPGLLYEVAR